MEWKKLFLFAKGGVLCFPVRKFMAGWPIPMIMVRLGAELKNNIKQLWWKYFVKSERRYGGLGRKHSFKPKSLGGIRAY